MPTLLIAAASALILAAVVTEAAQRFFPNSYFALLVITFAALFVNGLFNARLKQTPASQGRNKTDNRTRSKSNQRQGDKSARGEKTDRGGKSARGGKQDRGERTDRGGKQDRGERTDRGQKKDGGGQKKPRGDQSATPAQPEPSKAPDGPTETGTVKWFNRSKGYGFIVRDNGEEIFVHQRSIVRDSDSRQRPVLRDGQQVSFVVSHQEKGAQAEHVQGLD